MADWQVDRITPLHNDHKEIARQLDRVRDAIRASRSPPRGRLRESIDRLSSTVEMHLLSEESGLYEPLRLRLGRDSPIGMMASQHRSIRGLLRQLRYASDEYAAGRGGIGNVRTCFYSLQRETAAHVEKEEKVLFWLADLKL